MCCGSRILDPESRKNIQDPGSCGQKKSGSRIHNNIHKTLSNNNQDGDAHDFTLTTLKYNLKKPSY
jgi:hypothetical protein